jgi:hypothetical protein
MYLVRERTARAELVAGLVLAAPWRSVQWRSSDRVVHPTVSTTRNTFHGTTESLELTSSGWSRRNERP